MIYDGKEDGKWIYYNEKGNIITERIYSGGLKNGAEIWYYDNKSKMLERNYLNGTENGLFRAWFKNGMPKFEGNSVDGKIIRYIEWDETGKAVKIFNSRFDEKNSKN